MLIQQRTVCVNKNSIFSCKSTGTEWNIIKVVLHVRIWSRMFFGMLDPDLSIGTRYGSGSFYHQAKILRKTLIAAVLSLL
jgi:hypothetical protein